MAARRTGFSAKSRVFHKIIALIHFWTCGKIITESLIKFWFTVFMLCDVAVCTSGTIDRLPGYESVNVWP
jgi:hypothetical protein